MEQTEMNRKQQLFAEVYDTYAGKIYSYVYYKTYHRETAEDLTATTFLKAIDKWQKYDPAKGSVAAWLYGIARNLVADFYRQKQHTVNIDDIWDLPGDVDVPLDVQNRLLLAEVRTIMQQLPAEQREILIMRIWQNLSYKEIAEATGKSEAACKMSFSRLIGKLRSELAVSALVLLFLFPGLI